MTLISPATTVRDGPIDSSKGLLKKVVVCLPCHAFQHAKAQLLNLNLVSQHVSWFCGGGGVIRAHGAGRGGAQRGLRDPELASYRKLPNQAQPPQV